MPKTSLSRTFTAHRVAKRSSIGSMTNWAFHERRHLVQLMRDLGPTAPTLCAGWTTADLAAHIAIRERRPDAALGIVAPFVASHTKSVMAKYSNKPWKELLHLVEEGAPLWNPLGLPNLDNAANLFEMFVHHEDVRRAIPEWKPRALHPELETALWERMAKNGKLMWRRAKVGIVLDNGSSQIVVKKSPAGTGTVMISGTTADLVLLTYGRNEIDVTYSGDENEVAVAKTTNCSV